MGEIVNHSGMPSDPGISDGFGSMASGDANMEVLRKYDIFQATKMGLLSPCQGSSYGAFGVQMI